MRRHSAAAAWSSGNGLPITAVHRSWAAFTTSRESAADRPARTGAKLSSLRLGATCLMISGAHSCRARGTGRVRPPRRAGAATSWPCFRREPAPLAGQADAALREAHSEQAAEAEPLAEPNGIGSSFQQRGDTVIGITAD
jgi:hypothetical protein